MLALLLAAAATCAAPTPEDALRRLEDAYRNKDVEAAVACKDFRREARLVAKGMKNKKPDDAALLARIATTLEQGYRVQLEQGGFPPMTGAQCRVIAKRPGAEPDLIIAKEACSYSDGSQSEEELQLAKVGADFRVLTTPPDPPR